jgi:hypothetical protein
VVLTQRCCTGYPASTGGAHRGPDSLSAPTDHSPAEELGHVIKTDKASAAAPDHLRAPGQNRGPLPGHHRGLCGWYLVCRPARQPGRTYWLCAMIAAVSAGRNSFSIRSRRISSSSSFRCALHRRQGLIGLRVLASLGVHPIPQGAVMDSDATAVQGGAPEANLDAAASPPGPTPAAEARAARGRRGCHHAVRSRWMRRRGWR